MRLLFSMDKKDYQDCTHTYVRHSARSIIISGGKVAMVHSAKYDYYKFPGGGIEEGEEILQALQRETLEETGLVIREETVEEYGYVHRILRSIHDRSQCFIQDNYYYFCQVDDTIQSQALDHYESEEGYSLVFVEPEIAIQRNRSVESSPYDASMFEREARVLEMLVAEGYFHQGIPWKL